MRFLLEVVLQSDDAAFLERDEVEDALQQALMAAGIGEVTGAGSGLGVSNLDVEVTDLDEGLALVRTVPQDLEVPPSTMIYLNQGDATKGTDKVTPYPVISTPDRASASRLAAGETEALPGGLSPGAVGGTGWAR